MRSRVRPGRCWHKNRNGVQLKVTAVLQITKARSTTVLGGQVDPIWPRTAENRLVLFPTSGYATVLKLEIWNHNTALDELIGHTELDLEDEHWRQQSDYGYRTWLTLEPQGKLELTLHSVEPVTEENIYVGIRVQRGPSWVYTEDLDGGIGHSRRTTDKLTPA